MKKNSLTYGFSFMQQEKTSLKEFGEPAAHIVIMASSPIDHDIPIPFKYLFSDFQHSHLEVGFLRWP